ncbi:MAG TPA: hypothetical protein P5511_00440 [Candidatus Goldiibacteriota bacterium]|nr:hypothetical protein [Candidatus Goldiibacteriota bacterium]
MSKNKNRDQQQKPQHQEEGTYTIKDYLVINAVFWVFLLILAFAVFLSAGGKWDPIMANVFTFIFLVFGCGFTAVSFFDFFYERISAKNEEKS